MKQVIQEQCISISLHLNSTCLAFAYVFSHFSCVSGQDGTMHIHVHILSQETVSANMIVIIQQAYHHRGDSLVNFNQLQCPVLLAFLQVMLYSLQPCHYNSHTNTYSNINAMDIILIQWTATYTIIHSPSVLQFLPLTELSSFPTAFSLSPYLPSGLLLYH